LRILSQFLFLARSAIYRLLTIKPTHPMNTSTPSTRHLETKESPEANVPDTVVTNLIDRLTAVDRSLGVQLLGQSDPVVAATALQSLSPDAAASLFTALPLEIQKAVASEIPSQTVAQWTRNNSFAPDTVGRLMEPPIGVFHPHVTVAHTIDELRELVKREFITYVYVVNETDTLIGLVVMRDLLFADPTQTLSEVMLRSPFTLNADTPLMNAMKEVLVRHYPVYPVTSSTGELVGLVRGHRLFEAQAIEISAQAGSMVGVEKGERITTPLLTSFKYRHPWLQLNLLTAFVAGAVVNFFQGTIDQIVVLAAFLPVLAGQSGNTGCQALAVTLRGMTLGELQNVKVTKLIAKEGLLGLCNGVLVGLSAATGMYLLASSEHHPSALTLSGIVLMAMIGSCFISGLSGSLVPLVLRKVGADPATASSIFLTTATDVASMSLLLGLATLFML
jgi:magnesium transporter